jgi:hypothetical protein
MQEHYLIVAIVAVIAIIIISLFIVVANLQKTVVVETPLIKQAEEKKRQITIEMMVEIAAKRTSTKNDLTNAVMRVANECPFPPKEKGVIQKHAKVYLNFILLVASHRHADAKLIAFMDETLKKANPEYKQEIDIYENEGIHQRGNRI